MEKEIEEINNNNMTKGLMSSDEEDNTNIYTIEKLPKNYTNYNKSIKIILLGDSGVGKTSLLKNLGQEESNINEYRTISLEYFNYNIKINNYIIRMQIWDTVGHEKFNSITSNYYKTTDIAIFIYSINDINSFNNINNWYNELNNKNEEDNNMIKILIGNKNDLIKERKVSYDMGIKLKNDKNFNLYKEINCQNNNNNKNNNGKKIWNINIEKIDEDEDLDPIKKLFFNIGILIYKEYFEEIRNRVNTNSIYCYEASNSILEFAQESDTKTLNNNFEKHKSCCC